MQFQYIVFRLVNCFHNSFPKLKPGRVLLSVSLNIKFLKFGKVKEKAREEYRLAK